MHACGPPDGCELGDLTSTRDVLAECACPNPAQDYDYFVVRPTPWSAASVLSLVYKHWIAAFGQVLPRRVRDAVKAALDIVQRPPRAATVADVYACRHLPCARPRGRALTRRRGRGRARGHWAHASGTVAAAVVDLAVLVDDAAVRDALVRNVEAVAASGRRG